MTVYVDELRWKKGDRVFCHMTADTTEELHLMASVLGLKKCWFHGVRRGHPHYDLTAWMRCLALDRGALFVPALEQARRRKKGHE